ncbi:DUF3488 and transglutaminase-like domain-containing protein [Marinobacterium sp. D7]|uniref:transglutaminase TgpA family protein n=1 Tax=Marinobacterium ramblicola TaxID=2849041 RepID=UPI001C2D2B18|nr:DUF3488 and transglutaminase-like domain-containing protein [Marinobacterium ramblicola]MBV1789552.1 DUF3488 and transglutaminase-like domain-containing protein [Marinobacterium ramblicola]
MRQISRAAVIWQLIAFAGVVIPHVSWLPFWLGGLCLVTPAVRLMIHTGRWPLPHWSVKLLLILAVAAGLLLSFSRETGMNATVALLVAGLALKMIEIYHRRDALVLLYVALFVCATSFLYHQSIAMALYALFSVVLVIAALNSIYQDPQRTDLIRPLRRSLRLVSLSIPLMLVLFVLFPRIGPLWSVSMNQQRALSGLSDTMAPGDISQLTKSAALAFRVSFDREIPEPAQRYWRSLIYTEFDGRSWRVPAEYDRRSPGGESLLEVERLLSYEVIYEPTNRHWLVALDQPLSAPQGMRFSPGHTLYSLRAVDRRQSYRLRSALEYRLQPILSGRDHTAYTQLPDGSNRRARELALQRWQEVDQDPERFVARVLAQFNRAFTYTLTPPPLGQDPIDGFLFDSRQGFCGHYAGALAFLLRSVGIPARVVGGYQGGEWNPYERYITVRQYDAHAWVEYWLDGRGWVRVDPTAAVSPERVVEAADQVFARDPAFLADTPLARWRFGGSGWVVDLRRQIDALNFNWHRWVLNYQGQQMELLTRLMGQVSVLKMVFALLLPFSLVMLFMAWTQLKGRRAKPRDPVDRALQRLLSRLARLGVPRCSDETLQTYTARVVAEYPEMRSSMEVLARLDEAVRYAGQSAQARDLLAAINDCYRALRAVRPVSAENEVK